MNFDLILKNGWVIDGTGGPAFRADVGVLGTKIAAVGRLDGGQAARRSSTWPAATSSPGSSTPTSTATPSCWPTRSTCPRSSRG